MQKIVEKAQEYREFAAARAFAHERSAEAHRRAGVKLGVSSTVLSAIVGSSVFVAASKNYSLNGESQCATSMIIAFICGLFLIAVPVLTGVQTYLNHPEQAARHKASWVGFLRVQQQLDLFILRYDGADGNATDRDAALKELNTFIAEVEKIADSSITLSRRVRPRNTVQNQLQDPERTGQS